MKKETAEKLKLLFDRVDIEVNFSDLLNNESEYKEIKDYDDLFSYAENNNYFNNEVIYYWVAMEYLMEHDTSLNESINIALEYGYELEGINSELLATLLKQKKDREQFTSLEDEITEIFDEEEDEEEDDEEKELNI